MEQDLQHLALDGYLLGPSFCRQNLQSGGVCTFIKKDQRFNKIDISVAVKNKTLKSVYLTWN
jgi:hypothetical protein